MSVQRTSAASSSSSIPRWKNDVFLSFRGEDTRKGFTDHLYTALERQGIRTFRDDPELQKGKAVSPELLTAIEESEFGLIVLSQNYASSTWCLDELLKILECMEARGTLLPIFYDVDPSGVRKQTGSFSEAFTNHEERFRDDAKKVQRWRNALTTVANISGWNSKDRYEAKLIEDIVQVIRPKLSPTLFSSVENLVGIDSWWQPINLRLGLGVDDVRFIGIWGMGGVGKTTIARFVYEKISPEFEFKIFLANVRENFEKGGLTHLQNQLLSGIGMRKENICDQYNGTAMIRRFLCHKKVLLILDDVNHSHQLEYLAGAQEWFGIGSRVVITTRDEHLLTEHGVERRWKVQGLKNDNALKLFCCKAFKKDYPEQNYLDLSNSVVNYANGLPLALKVLGSYLYGRDLSSWKSALGKLRDVGHSEILETLKISYDGLDDNEKKIFLDIACFFNREGKGRAAEILDACGFHAVIGIDVLVEKSLLDVSKGYIDMHDLIQEMGRLIVRGESPDEPGKHSRLWLREDINLVLSRNTGTEAIECIVVHPKVPGRLHPEEPGVVHAKADSFSMMNKLRHIKINSVELSNGLEYLPDNLRILEWTDYPLKYFPSHFPAKLVELIMPHSRIENFWTGIKPLYSLKTINLSHSLNLINTPNFSGMPYLKRLILEGCIRLYKVHPSLGALERLSQMNLKDCKSLVCLPSSVCGLKSLKVLNLSGCSKLDKLPSELGHVECLEELDVSGTAIREPPSFIGSLRNFKALSFRGCKGPLPKSWNMILHPFQLLLKRSLQFPTALLLPSLCGLHSLTNLNLSDCNLVEGAIPNGLSCMSSLKELNLSRNNFVSLPRSFSQLSGLEYLNLEYCQLLQTLPELPYGVAVYADYCMSLETLSGTVSKGCNILQWASCFNCLKLGEKQDMAFTCLKQYLQDNHRDIFGFLAPGKEISKWFNHQNMGELVSLELHPGWYSDKWKGFAMCVAFEISDQHHDQLAGEILCQLIANGRSLYPSPGRIVKGVSESAHVWLFYLPRQEWFENEWQDIYTQLEFSFVTDQGLKVKKCGIRMVGLKVKKCGIRLVYEGDWEEIGQTLSHNSNVSISEEVSEFPQCDLDGLD